MSDISLVRSLISRLPGVLLTGTLASIASATVLAWRGWRENGRALGPLNAPAHWLWGGESLRRDGASLRHTLTGVLVHHASSLFWAVFYELLRLRRASPTPVNAIGDAAAITAVAAAVDLRLVPQRLTPGFERRISRRGLVWVYASFAAGLALGACFRRR